MMSNDDFPIDGLPAEELSLIDIDAINADSEEEAKSMVNIVTNLFYDEEFKKAHPQIHKRIELEIETLRGLIKMRKADEESHDALLKAISENHTNASLYRSMAEIQKTSIAITNKIHDTIDRLNKICADVTSGSEMINEDEQFEGENPKKIKAHRGTKEFIQELLDNEENS